MKQREKLFQRTVDLHREITRAGLTRRELLKMGLLSSATGLLLPISGLSLRAAWAKDGGNGSGGACAVPGKRPLTPFKDPMPRLVNWETVRNNDPASISAGNGGGAPGADPVGNLAGGDSKIRLLNDFPQLAGATPYANLAHQAWKGGDAADPSLSRLINPPKKWYEMHVRQHRHQWHSELNPGTGNPAWGFGSDSESFVPGPCFRTRYGESHFVRIHNDLPNGNGVDNVSPLGFGTPVISTHMHNLHTPSESDGNPLYWNYPGHYYDYHYPNVYAGVNQYGGIGDAREALGTLWYHDHKLDFTAQNVYAGLAGLNCIYDEFDSGDHSESSGLRLPCGDNYEFDVPLVFHDRAFDANGVDYFPLACFDGAIGNEMTVNGVIQPYFEVKRRKYRFRFLDMGPSRFYWWFLSDNSKFTVIANDGNLLPAPVQVQSFKQGVAERFDVIIDFSSYKNGDRLYLVNRGEQLDGRGPTGNLLRTGIAVLQFRITDQAFGTDNSVIPTRLRELPDMNQPVVNARRWEFNRQGGGWAVNGNQFNRDVVSATIPEGTAEHWTIVNGGGSWSHPVHIHYEEHRYLSYNRLPPPPIEAGRKDVIRLDPNAQVEIYMRFRDYKGLYPMHCHNVVHEDHAMMVMWKIV